MKLQIPSASEVFALRVSWRAKLVLLALVLVEAKRKARGARLAWRIAERTGLPVMAVEECLRAAGALRPGGPGARACYRVELSAVPKQRPFRGRKGGLR